MTSIDPKVTALDDLRTLYRAAFEEWASQVRRVGDMQGSDDRGQLAAAKSEATSAEAHYREVRNRLADETDAHDIAPQDPPTDELLRTSIHLEQMDDPALDEFLEMCEQFCSAAIRRGEQPPVFFASRRRLASEEIARRGARSR